MGEWEKQNQKSQTYFHLLNSLVLSDFGHIWENQGSLILWKESMSVNCCLCPIPEPLKTPYESLWLVWIWKGYLYV